MPERKSRHTILSLLTMLLLLFSASHIQAQLTNGSSGLLNIPEGEIQPDKTMFIGMNYLPEGLAGNKFNYNTANYFFNLSFLPFIEATYRLTLIRFIGENKSTNQDRAFGVKWRLWKETRIRPSLLAGMDDIYTTSGSGSGNQYFASIFFASSKTFHTTRHFFRLTAGYGFNTRNRNRLNGFFAGINYSPKQFSSLHLLAEYDTKRINVAASLLIKKHLSIYGGCYDFHQLAAGISYCFLL